ncbi:MAG: ANTAR domain-containing response regulator [Gemmataceae bacterium]
MQDPESLPRVLVVSDGDETARAGLVEAAALVGVPTADPAAKPDALLYRLAAGGTDALRALLEAHRPAAVVLIDGQDRALIADLAALPVQAVLLPPHAAEQITAGLTVAIARHRERSQLALENEQLHQQLASRKLIERAKGALMKRFRWAEPEAFRRLQRAAMNQRVTMADLARQILDGHDVPL